MFDFSEIQMNKLVVHKVGNKLREEGCFLSPHIYPLFDANLEELLLKYFLSPFKDKILYKFFHETDIHLHELYNAVTAVFINRETFYEQSIHIANHLYEKARHPQIKAGEFYLAYFSGCMLGEQTTDAIGIFKTETKENFITIHSNETGLQIAAGEGINIKKLDKGCIIFNSHSVDGYRVAIVDNTNKNSDALYWKEDFLQLADLQDEYFHTKNCLEVCQDFAENVYGVMHDADKKERVVFMNEAISYFNNNKEFQIDDFVETVVKEPELAQQFKEYKEAYEANQGIPSTAQFNISGHAVKTAKRKLKNLIKLDTDIEIKLTNPSVENGGADFIERGFDQNKGMNYYKIYFHSEE